MTDWPADSSSNDCDDRPLDRIDNFHDRRHRTAAVSMHAALRSATRDAHHRVDMAMSAFDLADPADYRAFLGVHESALNILSTRWGPDDSADFEALLGHVRSDLGESRLPDDRGVTDGSTTSRSRQAGVAYVLRGSRFGAAILRERVAATWASDYLDYRVIQSWPAFLERLESLRPSIGRSDLTEMIGAAQAAFDVFASAAAAVAVERCPS
jgi:heme oxygenase (biliverdin-IX-beta and delta-forming)